MPSKLGSLALEFVCCLFFVCMCFVNLRFVCCSRRHRRYLHRWSNNFKLEPLTWVAPFVFLLISEWLYVFVKLLWNTLLGPLSNSWRRAPPAGCSSSWTPRCESRRRSWFRTCWSPSSLALRSSTSWLLSLISCPTWWSLSIIQGRLFRSSISSSRQLRNSMHLYSTTS